MPSLPLLNELNTNGHKQVDPLIELSMQRRAVQPSSGVYQWWFGQRFDTGSEIAPWWSPQRDWDLRLFWMREGNDILQGAIASMLKWGRTLAWVIEGPNRVARKYQSTLAESEFGEGWGQLMSKVLTDYYTQDKGATIELIGDGEPDKPLVGPVVGLAHIDSQYVQPTGDVIYPILFNNPKDGLSHKVHTTRVLRLVDMPSPSERMCGVGFCVVSRIIAASQVLLKLTRYKNEKLSDMPEAGLLILNNILPKQWEDAQANHAHGRRKLGEEVWSPIMTLFSIDPAQPATANLTSFANLPDGFDEQQATNLYVYIVALAFGVDPREFWPVSQGSLGTGRESQIQSEKAEGKGKGDIIAAIERAINWKVLPDSVNFRFDNRDDQQDKLASEINKTKTETIWGMWDSEAYRAGLQPPVSTLEIRQMLADNVPDYFKPEFLEVEMTDEAELTDTETEDVKALGPKAVYRSDGRRVSKGYKNADKLLEIVEENYKAGRISLDDLIEFRLGKVLDEREKFNSKHDEAGRFASGSSSGGGTTLFHRENESSVAYTTNYKPLAKQKADALAKKTGIPHKVVQVGEQYNVVKQGEKTPPKITKKLGADSQGESALNLKGTTLTGGTAEQQAAVQETLKQVPAWHLQGAGNSSRLGKIEVYDKPDLNKEVEKIEGRSLSKGVSIAGFADEKGGIALAGRQSNLQRNVAHEVAHVVFENPNSNATAKAKIKETQTALNKLYTKRNNSGEWSTVSNYAKVSKSEFAAEIYGHFLSNPGYIKAVDPEAYAIIKGMF